jgi:hypothetical protein
MSLVHRYICLYAKSGTHKSVEIHAVALSRDLTLSICANCGADIGLVHAKSVEPPNGAASEGTFVPMQSLRSASR